MAVIQLFDCGVGRPTDAEVDFVLKQSELSRIDEDWVSFRERGLSQTSRWSGHWRWARKLLQPGSYLVVGIRCQDEIQGLVMLNEERVSSRGRGRSHELMLYVEYMEVAPWNLPSAGGASRRFSGVGLALLTAAAQISLEDGLSGRLALHSLPESEGFYRAWFEDLGIDRTENLRYFELDTAGATRLLKGDET